MEVLKLVLQILEKIDAKGIFFVTGHMGEKLASFPEVLDLLRTHEIGYHSSSHSVHPAVFEYTDKEYENAYSESLKRETSHISPLSGEIEGTGGIRVLQDLFHPKKILAYRAPGFYFSPPNLEAMASLGIEYDFTSNLSRVPVFYRDVTFYPMPLSPDCTGALFDGQYQMPNWFRFLCSISAREVTVLDFHPSVFVNKVWWDSIYHQGNPRGLFTVLPKAHEKTEKMLWKFAKLLKMVRTLQRFGLVEITPELRKSDKTLDPNRVDVSGVLRSSQNWPQKFYSYEPKYLSLHLARFLGHLNADRHGYSSTPSNNRIPAVQ